VADWVRAAWGGSKEPGDRPEQGRLAGVVALGLVMLAIAVGVIVYAAAGQQGSSDGGQDVPAPATTDSPTRTVTVLTVDGDTGEPVPGAIVAAGSATRATGSSGEATVPAGAGWLVKARRSGWTDDETRVAALDHLTLALYEEKRQWTKFGYDLARTNANPSFTDRPPYELAWQYEAVTLLEFPVSAYKGIVVGTTGRGRVFCLDAKTGRERWRVQTRSVFAAQPALSGDRAYVTGMDRRVYCFRLSDGKILWTFDTGGPIESSPVLEGDRLYTGTWNNAVFCLDARTGRRLWRFETGGDVKGTPAIAGNRLYVGAYDGSLYCVDKRNGRLIWRQYLGGTIYSAPAVKEGRVYVGTTAGTVDCVSAANGARLWRYQTGDSHFGVYSSPAVAHGLVYVGSFDGRFYALNARTGSLRWSFDAQGYVSGSPAVIGDIVYMASLAGNAWAIQARTGKVLHTFPDGRYTPASANGQLLFIAGRKVLYAYRGRRVEK
jgi:outer membrane protein assembly factor BamB